MVTQIHKFKSSNNEWPPHNLVWDKKKLFFEGCAATNNLIRVY